MSLYGTEWRERGYGLRGGSKEINANRFFRDSHWLEIWKKTFMVLHGTEWRERGYGLSWPPSQKTHDQIHITTTWPFILLLGCLSHGSKLNRRLDHRLFRGHFSTLWPSHATADYYFIFFLFVLFLFCSIQYLELYCQVAQLDHTLSKSIPMT